MKSPTDRLLRELPEMLPPPFSLQQVEAWVEAGRPRRRFHAFAWLNRVFRFSLS